jgi:hypothetical protein
MNEFLQKECVSLEHAEGLKDLGFNEPYCIGYYENGLLNHNDAFHTNESLQSISESLGNVSLITAPTFQQAFRWIRDAFGHHHITLFNRFYVDRMFTFEVAEKRALSELIYTIKERKINEV